MILSLVIASHVIVPAPAPVYVPEPVAVMIEADAPAPLVVEVSEPVIVQPEVEPTPATLPEVEVMEGEHAWPTSGLVEFEDGSWRNMDTGESGCYPDGLCATPAPWECGPGLVLVEDGSCVEPSFFEGMPERYAPTFGYGPCEYEDSVGCYWDASLMGNGQGDSFVVHPDGTVIYWED